MLQTKGPRVATSRWGTRAEADAHWQCHHRERLLTILLLGIKQGWLQKGGAATLIVDKLAGLTKPLTKARDLPPGQSRDTIKQSKESIANLRDRCRNTMHVTANVLCDPKVYADMGMLGYVCHPIRREHNLLASSLRSVDDLQEHMLRAALLDTSYLHCLGKLTSPFARIEGLARCGITIGFDSAELKRLSKDSPEVLAAAAANG